MIGERSMNPPIVLPEVEANRERRRESGSSGVDAIVPSVVRRRTSATGTSQSPSSPYTSSNQYNDMMMDASPASISGRIQPVQVSVISNDMLMMKVPSKSLKMSEERHF